VRWACAADTSPLHDIQYENEIELEKRLNIV
jgi:hypothetical protein